MLCIHCIDSSNCSSVTVGLNCERDHYPHHLEKKLNVSVQLACVVDEESGACSSIGVRYLLEQKLISGTGAIYVYPGLNVTIGHRGLLRLTIAVTGENAHTGSAEWNTRKKGANAVSGYLDDLWHAFILLVWTGNGFGANLSRLGGSRVERRRRCRLSSVNPHCHAR